MRLTTRLRAALVLTKFEVAFASNMGGHTPIVAMNKIITASEANRKFSKMLPEVGDSGISYTITVHGKPVADLVPRVDKEKMEKARRQVLRRLRKQQPLNSGPFSRDEAYDDDL
jgi:prevent-host-death family protein